jgi:Sulfatase-modifying factor enzyme 1
VGNPQINTGFQLTVRNTAVANPLPGRAYLSLSSQPATGFPEGLLLPGLGLAFPGATGELLIHVTAPNPFFTLGPATYPGGSSGAASFDSSVPFSPGPIGLDLFAQGLLVTPAQGFALGLTNGLQLKIGSPHIPGLVLIYPGTFLMGSNVGPGEPYFGAGEEQPEHRVTLSRAYWMGTTEVTQVQYQALMGTNPSRFVNPEGPVDCVSRTDAQAHCRVLTRQQSAPGNLAFGYHDCLPTEAEWEYACRADTTTEFNVGRQNRSAIKPSSATPTTHRLAATPAARCPWAVTHRMLGVCMTCTSMGGIGVSTRSRGVPLSRSWTPSRRAEPAGSCAAALGRRIPTSADLPPEWSAEVPAIPRIP